MLSYKALGSHDSLALVGGRAVDEDRDTHTLSPT